MFFYTLGMLVTMIVIVFLSILHVGSKEPYQLNRIYGEERPGLRLFNRLYLAYLVPWLFLPLIQPSAFRYLFVVFILLLTLAMEDVLYVHALFQERNRERVLVMLLFNLVLLGMIYIISIRFLSDTQILFF